MPSKFVLSLGEDAINRINHVGAFLFLLSLAIITLLIPLSPYFRMRADVTAPPYVEISDIATAYPVRKLNLPDYTAKCFEAGATALSDAKIAYANEACASLFNDALNTLSLTATGGSLSATYSGSSTFEQTVAALYNNADNLKSGSEIKSDYDDFLAFKTPLYLFIFAFCYRLPPLIYHILTILNPCLNIPETIKDAKKALNLDPVSRKRAMDEIATNTFHVIKKQSECSSGDDYFISKFFTCVATIAQLLTVIFVCFPDINDLEDDLERWTREFSSSQSSTHLNELNTYLRSQWTCAITSIGNTNCLFSPDPSSLEWAGRALVFVKMYKAVWTAVFALLIMLTAFNVVEEISWFVNMFVPSVRNKIINNVNVKMDISFLLRKAQTNAGCYVQKELEKSFLEVADPNKSDDTDAETRFGGDDSK